MASRRIRSIAAATAVVLGVGGYFLYSVFAVQGQGKLADAPLNVQTRIPPAFIMGVDDSGSMTFEGLYAADEQAYWGNTTACLNGQVSCPNGFFDGGAMRTNGRGLYYHLIQNGIRLDYNTALVTNNNGMRLGIPPLDLFGFARSPAYNKQWFNPAVTYEPWKYADGTSWPAATITSARSDPRADGAAGTRGPVPRVTYDFTAVEDRTANYFAFRFQPGMRLPQGTEYFIRPDRHPLGCGGLPSTASWQTINVAAGHLITTTNNLAYSPGTGGDRGGGCEIHVKHFPAVVFLPSSSPPPPGFDTSRAVTVPNAGGAGVSLVKYELRPGNFTSNYAEVIQNFANWYSYYGNRNRAMVGAMSESLLTVNNMRVGYFTINGRNGTRPGMIGGNLLMRDMNAGQKPDLYADLFTLPADGGTPTRSATVYMGDQFSRTDRNAPVQRACQVNAGMLFTDGYTNETAGSVGNVYRSFGNTDSGQPRPIGGNPNANTIADIAYSFYANNLRPDLPAGLVRPREGCSALPLDLRLDCQTNLHMNFYGITLGATGEIYGVNAAATDNPYTTFPNWSVTGTQNLSPRNVDDIWHATINTRGEFVNAQTPADITAAMRRVIAAVNSGSSPAGSLAVTGARINANTLAVSPVYEARNEGTDWYSRLSAQAVSTNPLTGEASFTPAWEASQQIPVAATRNNVWYGRGNVAPLEFTALNLGSLDALCDNPRPGYSLCTAASIAAIGGTPAVTLDDAVAYLKGDINREVTRGGKLRFRTTRLGDIVNSTPVVSAPTDDYGYRSLPAPYSASYNTYLTTGKAARRPMVYAGANDGMFHAFDGRSDVASGGGTERFAFIPQSVLGFTGNLLFPYVAADGGDQKFQHRYYVDGPVVVSDAYYGGVWNTVAVGTTGAGARGAFALDVSRIAASGSFLPSDRLWEISDLNTALNINVRENIGHVLGRPVVVPVKTGSRTGPVTWRAIFGNGYNSVSGKAVLFMVDIGTGTPQVRMLEGREAAAPAAGTNGLGNIVVIDRWGPASDDTLTARTRDGFADTVYAADQKGAVWKFDLRTDVAVNSLPAVPNQTTPLFTTKQYTTGPDAGTRQPILGGLTAAAGPGGGVLVYFGTGSFSFEGDAIDSSQQSLYAVLDGNAGAPTSTLTFAGLLQQTIISTEPGGIRNTSSNMMPVGSRGWYLDLPASERFVGYPRIESGVIFMPTYAANATVECGAEGSNWLYGLNALSGAAGLSNVRFGSPTGDSPGSGTGAVTLNTGGTAPVKDVAVFTSPRIQPLGSGASDADLADALAAQCSMVIQVAGAPPLYLPRACGRQSWRQIQ